MRRGSDEVLPRSDYPYRFYLVIAALSRNLLIKSAVIRSRLRVEPDIKS
jgi:hypothetical protein